MQDGTIYSLDLKNGIQVKKYKKSIDKNKCLVYIINSKQKFIKIRRNLKWQKIQKKRKH